MKFGIIRRLISKALPALLLAGLLALVAEAAWAAVPNRIQRVSVRPKSGFTRIEIYLTSNPNYTVAQLSGNRIRIVIEDTDGPLFKKYRRYSDANIGGLVFSRRGGNLLVTFQTAPGAGWRETHYDGVCSILIDVSPRFRASVQRPLTAGRDKIWSGVEKLVRDFDPPLKTDLPFTSTDRQVLKNLLAEAEQQSFMAAEAMLYKGQLTEAEEIFTQFATRQGPARPLALYRLGETSYKLQKYPQALAAFREAEKLWPAYLGFNAGVTFCYGDTLARSGDLMTGRTLLSSLIGRLADKKFAPTLLVRLGDIYARQGHDAEAMALYQNVADNFKDNKASMMVQLRHNDRQFLNVHPLGYKSLSNSYLDISRQIGDFEMREEALFKHTLLESLHGDAEAALQEILSFQRQFPRGTYATIMRNMREVIVGQVYQQGQWVKDSAALIRFVEEHQEYLSGCVDRPGFLQRVSAAYNESGRPIELITLFSFLAERQWASSGVPYMYEEIADNADLLGDSAMAEKTLRTFLRKFPNNPKVQFVTERLAAILFAAGKHREVSDNLTWLFKKGARAQKAESYYYLARSLWSQKDYSQAAKAVDLYIASASPATAKFLPDAYFVGASSRESTGDRKGALLMLDAGLKLPDNKRRDEFLYKSGEINLLEGKKQQAKICFELVVSKGKDPDWQRLAQQALGTLQ